MIDDRFPAPERSEGGGASEADTLGHFVVRGRLRIAASLLSLALLACSAPSETAVVAASIRDSAGVQIVTSTTPAWREGEGWQVDTVPVTVIGADENDQQQQWRYIEAAARFADGRIAVAIDGSIRLFRADGYFDRLLTVRGEGPGEFRGIGALRVLAGDTLRAHDPWLTRVAFFSPDGRYAREERTAPELVDRLGRWTECVPTLLSDGSRLLCQDDSSTTRTTRDDGYVPGPQHWVVRRWLIPPALDTSYPIGREEGMESFGVRIGPGRVVLAAHPFNGRAQIASGGAPTRIAMASGSDYRVELWTPGGMLERVVHRIGARRAPTVAERAGERTLMARSLEYLDRATRDRVLDGVPTPDSMPAVVDLELTSDGYLLVQREGLLEMQPVSIWDVFAPDGIFLGSFQLPGNARIIQAGADFLLVQRRSSDAGVILEVYRVRRSVPAPPTP